MVRTLGRYAGLKFEEDVYGYLQKVYGGHPFLIRVACSEIWRSVDRSSVEASAKVSAKDFETSALEVKARLEQPIRDILLSLVWWYPEEYELLQLLADGEEEFFRQYQESGDNSLVRFAQYGILDPDLSGRFAIADLREFLKDYGESYKQSLSPFARGDMPPDLLPAVPNLEVLGKLFQRKCELEILFRRLLIVYLGVYCNWDDSKISERIAAGMNANNRRKRPADLFIGRKPQEVVHDLYTLDLKGAVLSNWEVFSALFDRQKSRFEMNMDTVNRARRVDSHAKPVPPSEIEEFTNSYTWLISRLRKVPNLESP